MATLYELDEAEANLAKLIEQAEAGEDVSISRPGGRVIKLVAERNNERPVPRRVPGTLKGKIKLDDSFFDPLPEEELRLWEGR